MKWTAQVSVLCQDCPAQAEALQETVMYGPQITGSRVLTPTGWELAMVQPGAAPLVISAADAKAGHVTMDLFSSAPEQLATAARQPMPVFKCPECREKVKGN